MPNHILITGASGLVGKELTSMLLDKKHQVAQLGRTKKSGAVPSFVWDVNNKSIDIKALEGIDTIIHLAGASVAGKRWSESWKKEILDSRVQSSQLLFETLKNNRHQVKTFISASAIGYYGFTLSDELFDEQSKPGNDFLAQVVKAWEHEVDQIESLGIRVVKIRVGIVLSKRGGALEQMAKPIKLFAGSPLASGNQYLSWIHLDDLCGIFAKAVEDTQMKGIYNGVAPTAVTNREMTRTIADVLHRPLLFPNVPAFVLKVVVGEMANIVINGSNVSSRKVEEAGYVFRFKELKKALEDCFSE
jgi:uncharacterized protein